MMNRRTRNIRSSKILDIPESFSETRVRGRNRSLGRVAEDWEVELEEMEAQEALAVPVEELVYHIEEELARGRFSEGNVG